MSSRIEKAVVAILERHAIQDIRSRDPRGHILGARGFMKSSTNDGQSSRREQALDYLHASLERTPKPDEPVAVTLYPPKGGHITHVVKSLDARKKVAPAERERRRLLAIELHTLLSAGGF